jgi:RNA polymerase sigma factor (sigma-70 family)
VLLAMTGTICDIEAARAGDRQALERLLAQSRLDLRRYAEYHCIINDIDDAVQEALLRIAHSIRQLRAIEAFTSWLFRIVKRECNRLKRGMRHLRDEEIPLELLPAREVPYAELTHDIAIALEALPPHYREILLLRDMEGLTIAEIMQHLNLTREAAKARLHRARVLARELLDR